MPTNCYAVVDAQNKTLWTGASSDFSRAAMSYEAIALKSGNLETLYLILSHEDKMGTEILMELMTPLAKDFLQNKVCAQGATIEVWHEKTPRFGMDEMLGATSYPPQVSSDYYHVASISVPLQVPPALASGLLNADPLPAKTHEAIEQALDEAYLHSQNIDASWRPGTGCRSTSMGDILVFRCCGVRKAFKVRGAGFMEVEFK